MTSSLQFLWLPVPTFASLYLSFKPDQGANLSRGKKKKQTKKTCFPSPPKKRVLWSDSMYTCKTNCISIMKEEKQKLLKLEGHSGTSLKLQFEERVFTLPLHSLSLAHKYLWWICSGEKSQDPARRKYVHVCLFQKLTDTCRFNSSVTLPVRYKLEGESNK